MKTTTRLLVLGLSTLYAGAARAQSLAPAPAQGFGAMGQVAVAGDFNISLFHHSGVTDVTIQPAADYFIAPQLAIGGSVLFSYSGTDSASTTEFGLGPRVGYAIPLSALASFFPQGGFRFVHVTDSVNSGTGSISHSANYLTLALYAPFLFHPAPHFFIGLGPSLTVDLAGGTSASRQTTIGLESTVGGYFDW